MAEHNISNDTTKTTRNISEDGESLSNGQGNVFESNLRTNAGRTTTNSNTSFEQLKLNFNTAEDLSNAVKQLSKEYKSKPLEVEADAEWLKYARRFFDNKQKSSEIQKKDVASGQQDKDTTRTGDGQGNSNSGSYDGSILQSSQQQYEQLKLNFNKEKDLYNAAKQSKVKIQ